MTERLTDIEGRLASMHDLLGVVSAMRSMAAARVQQAQAALGGIRGFTEVVDAGLAQAIALLPPGQAAGGGGGRARHGLILFTAEHGFVGGFNERLLEALPPARPGLDLFIVGSRGIALAGERGIEPVWSLPMATQVSAVTDIVRRISDELYRRFDAGDLSTVGILYGGFHGGGHWTVETRSLLPLDPGQLPLPTGAAPPLTNLPPQSLVQRLVAEHFFANLAHAAMESFASENAARLATMQSARDHIAERLDDLTAVERRLRQEEITAELMELVGGAEASNGGMSG